MSIDLAERLGDLVTADPRRSRVLEDLGLDYCCHGQRTLSQACDEAGLDPADVAVRLDLADPEPAPEWQSYGVADLARHILHTHHTYLWDEMPRLRELVDTVHGAHIANHPELARVRTDYLALTADLADHLTKEEQILFPAIIAIGTPGAGVEFAGSVEGPITVMMAEHDVAGDLLRSIRATTNDFAVPPDACPSYTAMLDRLQRMEADLHEHIHKENNVLFPQVLQEDADSF